MWLCCIVSALVLLICSIVDRSRLHLFLHRLQQDVSVSTKKHLSEARPKPSLGYHRQIVRSRIQQRPRPWRHSCVEIDPERIMVNWTSVRRFAHYQMVLTKAFGIPKLRKPRPALSERKRQRRPRNRVPPGVGVRGNAIENLACDGHPCGGRCLSSP